MKLLKNLAAILLLAAGTIPAQRGPQPDIPPAQDLSGKWVMNRETTGRSGVKRTTRFVLTLKQVDNKLTGEVSYSTITMPDVPGSTGFPVAGWVEGNQMGVTGWIDFQGGETAHLRLTFKDGHLTGTRQSIHDSPHKWSLDNTVDVDYVKSTE